MKRYLGLEVFGAKNQKTALAVIEYYPKERKIFLSDLFDRIPTQDHETADEALLQLVDEVSKEIKGEIKNKTKSKSNLLLGVNVPLDLPPCITCTLKTCPLPENCTVPTVSWMAKTAARTTNETGKTLRGLTPYTQRPIEIWVRSQVLPNLPVSHRFEIDEALGGNRAPLTARMNFLKRHLHRYFKSHELLEIWPKLTVAILALNLEIHKRVITSYRHLEDGAHSREVFLMALAQKYQIFIYERDFIKLTNSLNAFDAFICAFTTLLSDQKLCAKIPKGFPTSAGWIQYPMPKI